MKRLKNLKEWEKRQTTNSESVAIKQNDCKSHHKNLIPDEINAN